ncbi:Protein sat1 [Escovopsis weberi]|uniref:Protein sat1 n=1 Tax=Escovopsis weberi TaxID=150374 RepID=A0A0N0RTY8_ESCWE|nr:Protein sat1 [Escovopsis weberi]
MPDSSGNIRVFVHWRDQTVFAGEDVKCTIIFRNVAQDPHQLQQHGRSVASPPEGHGRQHSHSDRGRLASPPQIRSSKSSINSPPPLSNASSGGGGHRRAALSLSVPSPSLRSRMTAPFQWHQPAASSASRSSHVHKRSVSIVSIGSTNNAPIDDHPASRPGSSQRYQRPRNGHNRAASLQISSWGLPVAPSTPKSGGAAQRQTSSPLAVAHERFERMIGASTSPRAKPIPQRGIASPRTSSSAMPEFRFPPASPADSEGPLSPKRGANGLLSPRIGASDGNGFGLRPKEQTIPERPALTARILSSTSHAGGTPRSSGEFYSMSNNSSETLVSEYPAQPAARSQGRPNHARGPSTASVRSKSPKSSESIMMGFAQIQGTFTLDSSLVSPAPFEPVRMKAVVGGRGGGVVGIESGSRENSIFRSFGFGGITSIGDLLGGGEMSTMKEMRGAANPKSVPILSTPQSILFVDLQLAPGESRAFEYTFRLPRGLPPSHKGKAIKISYSLVIGTQRAGGVKEQQLRTVEIPFRILGSANSYGEVPEHDLINPYILLRDVAQVKALGKGGAKPHGERERQPPASSAGMEDFLSYVEELANRTRDEAGGKLLSPTTDTNTRRPSVIHDDPGSVKEAIRLAILRSNMTGEGQQSPNRFEIARNGQRVGVVMLTRPAYRLGEVVTMVIDFADAHVPCYAVHMTLESTERVEPTLAVRSESSIQRMTRKVYVASSEATLYTRRVVFTPTIPVSATPDFVTTGVNFEWKIRVEFVVPSQGGDGKGSPSSEHPPPFPLLEQISQDEKGGLVLVAVENVTCESFDVLVPLRVYGAVGTGLERLERDEASDEGLVV